MTSSASTLPVNRAAALPTHSLTGDGIAAVIAPSRGAKITSLRDLATNREWLAKSSQEPPRRTGYGARFVEAQPYGFDEIMPTVEPCQLEPAEIMLPDHGECWSRPWRVTDSDDEQVCTEIDGVALSYRFSRAASLADDNSLRLDYTLTATGSTELTALWSAHPCFTARPGTKLVLPNEVTTLLDVSANPDAPTLVDFPGPGIDHVRLLPPGSCRTYYVEPDAGCSWAAVVDANGRWVRMSWNPTEVPYLGIKLDAGGHAAEPVISLMPSTGFYGKLSRAAQLGRAARIAPGATRRWSLTMSVGSDDPAL